MQPPLSGDAAVRRFTVVWGLSVVVKVAGLAVFLLLVMKVLGGF